MQMAIIANRVRVLAGATIIAAAYFAAAPSAAAQELRFIVGEAETFTAMEPVRRFAEAIAEQTELEPEVFNDALLDLRETGLGVRDGIVDAGFTVYPYLPAEFSELNLAANLSMLSTTGKQVENPGAAMAGAIMEYVFFECQDCLDQLEAQNHVFLATASTSPYALICTTPIRTTEDLVGKKLRSGAGSYGRWAEYMGAIKVTTKGSGEVYDVLSAGAADCTMNSAAELIGLRYIDLTSSMTLGVPGGPFSGIGAQDFNADVWAGLTPEQRKVILGLSARLAADIAVAYYNEAQTALVKAKEIKPDFEIIQASEDLLAKTEEFVEQDIETIKIQFKEEYGLEDVDSKVETMRALIEKWKGLVAGSPDDVDALTEIYNREIFSKLDENYGL